MVVIFDMMVYSKATQIMGRCLDVKKLDCSNGFDFRCFHETNTFTSD